MPAVIGEDYGVSQRFLRRCTSVVALVANALGPRQCHATSLLPYNLFIYASKYTIYNYVSRTTAVRHIQYCKRKLMANEHYSHSTDFDIGGSVEDILLV